MAYSEPGKTRARVLAFMRDRLAAGSPPTVREVQEAFGFRSVQSAREHLEALVAQGHLAKEPHKARAYRLPAGGAAPVHSIPLIGRVAAGALAAAIENPEGMIAVRSRAPRERLFALRVKGESMRDAGILPGDVVIVREQPTAEPGDIVVALVGDEATVKTLRIKRGRVELHPANPAFEPIVPRGDEPLSILGKVIEVRRSYEGPLV